MDVSDVPAAANTPPTNAPTLCTAHVFSGEIVIGATPDGILVRSGSPVRIASNGWPPAVLFDAVYASVALKTFGVQTAIAKMQEVWQHELSFGLTPRTPSERERAMRDGTKAKKQNVDRKRNSAQCYEHEELDAWDMLSLVPYLAAPPQHVHEVLEEERERQEREVQRDSEAKVHEWQKTLSP